MLTVVKNVLSKPHGKISLAFASVLMVCVISGVTFLGVAAMHCSDCKEHSAQVTTTPNSGHTSVIPRGLEGVEVVIKTLTKVQITPKTVYVPVTATTEHSSPVKIATETVVVFVDATPSSPRKLPNGLTALPKVEADHLQKFLVDITHVAPQPMATYDMDAHIDSRQKLLVNEAHESSHPNIADKPETEHLVKYFFIAYSTPSTKIGTVAGATTKPELKVRDELHHFDYQQASDVLAKSGVLAALDNSKVSMSLRASHQGKVARGRFPLSRINGRGITDMLISDMTTEVIYVNGTGLGAYITTLNFNISDTNTNASTICNITYTSNLNGNTVPVKLNSWHICGTPEAFEANMEFFAWSYVSYNSSNLFSLKFLHLFEQYTRSKGDLQTLQYLTTPVPIQLNCVDDSRFSHKCSMSTLSPFRAVVDRAH